MSSFKINVRPSRYVQFGGNGGAGGSGGDQNWTLSGTTIYNNNSGNVGIRTSTPAYNVDISGETRIWTNNVRIGIGAGLTGQDVRSIAIGSNAGNSNQSNDSIAIGVSAARCNQRGNAIAIGALAGDVSQNIGAIAIGPSAGSNQQDVYSIAIGQNAGNDGQRQYSIAIGQAAGSVRLGSNSIAIGKDAQATDVSFAIVLNATTSQLNADVSSFFVKPIDTSNGLTNSLLYNPVTGKISYNPSKTFVIDHPLDENKYLVHACLEGPEAGVYYRGKGVIDNNEFTTIELPEYAKCFKDFTIQITPIGKKNCFYTSEVEDNKFKVYGENGSFYWLVHALRTEIDVEPEKNKVNVKGSGPYLYL